MGFPEFEKIKQLLVENKIAFKEFEHEPVLTSEQASKVRGVDMKTGVKALILKNKKNEFVMALLPADRKLDAKKLGDLSGFGRLSFASPDEVMQQTNCEIGGVPPFGNIFGLKIFADNHLLENEIANFNAGLRTHSIQMKLQDLIQAVQPVLMDIAQPSA